VPVNIGEIARKAGVSRSTVSYVLSGKRQIGEATRARVMAIIDETNYRPSASARALSNGATRTLALVVPRLHHHLNIEIMQFAGAIAEAAAEAEFDTLISPGGDGEREDAIGRLVGERRVDGVILMETLIPDPRAERLMDNRFPFVTIGRAGYDDQHDWVDTDYGGLVEEAVARLVVLGHRRLALVNRPQAMLDKGYCLSVITSTAFEEACRSHGVAGVMVCCEEDDDAGRDCLDAILGADPVVTGIISVNDRSLDSMMDALAARRISVPHDMSVIAVASARVAGRTRPPVTAADVPAGALAATAVEALLARIDSPDAPGVRRLFRTDFTDRGSVAAAPTVLPRPRRATSETSEKVVGGSSSAD
jgi:DNA-binding LacI/PurR family transcriptional regulator